jgi:hypothetical protein
MDVPRFLTICGHFNGKGRAIVGSAFCLSTRGGPCNILSYSYLLDGIR